MTLCPDIETLSQATTVILDAAFAWCYVPAGRTVLEDARAAGGTSGGEYWVDAFAIGKYPITNAQYQHFLDAPTGYVDAQWWGYSPAGVRWRQDHPHARPTAFPGAHLPRTRVSWFDSLAFCRWLTAQLQPLCAAGSVRLPTEQEWQRAAVGETDWPYPGSFCLQENLGNYGNHIGQPAPVGSYPDGQSPYGVQDMLGNVWEWCLTTWEADDVGIGGYGYRHIKGGAWNVSNPIHLRALDRGGHSPRGQLNDCGFRCALSFADVDRMG